MPIISIIALAMTDPSLPDGSGWVGSWSPGIGDPSVMGWVTVAAYAAAAWTCFRLRGRFSAEADVLRRTERRVWGAVAAILFFLCINKQLDLQTAMTELLRSLAKHQGWYAIRGKLQLAFIAAMGVAVSMFGAGFIWLARRLPSPTKMAGVGLGLISGYVLVRAASFHHFDRVIGARILHLKMNWVLELGGISIVLAGGRWRAQQLRRGSC